MLQYNPNGDLSTVPPEADRVFNSSNGSLIAVSYEARAQGVKRGMRGDEARKACREVQLVQVRAWPACGIAVGAPAAAQPLSAGAD